MRHIQFLAALILIPAVSVDAQLLSEQQLAAANYESVDVRLFQADPRFKILQDSILEEMLSREENLDLHTGEEIDQMPRYPGGINGLLSDYYSAVVYPEKARRKGIEGRVILRYIVEKDGSVGDVSVVFVSDKLLTKAALRGMRGLKRWHPGFHHGEPVRVIFTQPVNFKLE